MNVRGGGELGPCMNSSKEITRDILKDQHLTFVCYHLSRGVSAKRPLSRRRRWVSANDCACTRDTKEICDPTRLYSFAFYETSDEEGEQMDLFEKDAPPDRIGVFDPDRAPTLIRVPTHFLDLLWNAGLAADGVLRSIEMIIQSQNRGGWAIFEASFNEKYVEPFNWPLDKNLRPKIGPPPADPTVVELRELRTRLRLEAWSGVVILAVVVLVTLWIQLWR